MDRYLSQEPDPLWGRLTLAVMAAHLRIHRGWSGTIDDPVINDMIREFLATDYRAPSPDALLDLANRLIPRTTNANIRCAKFKGTEMYFWRVSSRPKFSRLLTAMQGLGRGLSALAPSLRSKAATV